MSVLRMLVAFDRGQKTGLRDALDTPRADEDVYTAFDHWLSSLKTQEQRAQTLIAMLQDRITKQQ
jgi:hypothetical protein